MSLFGCFPYWAPTHFPEAIYLKYGPDNMIHWRVHAEIYEQH